MAQNFDISKQVSIYYSTMGSQSEKKIAEQRINDYMEECYSEWHELFVQINEIEIDSKVDTSSMNHSFFPFLVLNHIIQKGFDRITDIDGFYKELFDVYISNFKKIAKNQNCKLSSFLFTKFVLLFVNLAMKDKSNERFELTLSGFKSVLNGEEDFETRLMHARFIAKYIRFLYEEIYDKVGCFEAKNECVFKNKYCKHFIEKINDNLYQVQYKKENEENSDIPVDDILIGLSYAYMWVSEPISNNDFTLLSDVQLYDDIDNCLF